jgi:hypothetical protein
LFGLVNGRVSFNVILVTDAGNLPGRTDQAAQGGAALHDVGIVLSMHGRGHSVEQRGHVLAAANIVKLAAPLHLVAEGHEVRRLMAIVEIEDSSVDPAILLTIEVFGPEEGGDLDDGVAVDQD